jgi:hypothetical protein
MKTCKRCSESKEEQQFSIARRNVGGRMHFCKACEALTRIERQYSAKRAARPGYAEYSRERFRRYALDCRGRAIYMCNSAKTRAKDKNLPFEITVEYVQLFLEIGICQRSGFRFDMVSHNYKQRNAYAPSIDRIDSSGGYTIDNVQIVCDMYNHGKGQHSDEEFIRFCHQVARKNPMGEA